MGQGSATEIQQRLPRCGAISRRRKRRTVEQASTRGVPGRSATGTPQRHCQWPSSRAEKSCTPVLQALDEEHKVTACACKGHAAEACSVQHRSHDGLECKAVGHGTQTTAAGNGPQLPYKNSRPSTCRLRKVEHPQRRQQRPPGLGAGFRGCSQAVVGQQRAALDNQLL